MRRIKGLTHNHLWHVFRHSVISFFPCLTQRDQLLEFLIYVRTYCFHSAGEIDDRGTCHSLLLVNLVWIIDGPQILFVLRENQSYSLGMIKGFRPTLAAAVKIVPATLFFPASTLGVRLALIFTDIHLNIPDSAFPVLLAMRRIWMRARTRNVSESALDAFRGYDYTYTQCLVSVPTLLLQGEMPQA